MNKLYDNDDISIKSIFFVFNRRQLVFELDCIFSHNKYKKMR